jgi:hypothetical protein
MVVVVGLFEVLSVEDNNVEFSDAYISVGDELVLVKELMDYQHSNRMK